MSASVLGVIAAGAVFEDIDLVSAGLTVFSRYFEEGYLLNHYQLDPNWRFTVDHNGVWLTADADRGHEGFGYSAIDLALIGQILEIARYHGTDWWHRKAVKGATMKGAIETYFGWVMNPLTFPFTKPGETPPGPPNFGESILELANYHYPGEIPDLQEWLNNKRPVRELFGDKYITLNRGGLFQ
jgi:hypothetical protein